MIQSRLDISEGRIRFLELALRRRIGPTSATGRPTRSPPPDVQEWVPSSPRISAPRTVHDLLAGVRPGARVRRGPTRTRQGTSWSSCPMRTSRRSSRRATEHFLADPRAARPEDCGYRRCSSSRPLPGRGATRWEWQDVDVQDPGSGREGEGQARNPPRALAQTPPWLLEILLDAVPPDDRTADGSCPRVERGHDARRDRPCLPRSRNPALLAARSPSPARLALARLRDAPRELAERMGHNKASMSLDVYAHAMPPDEAAMRDRFRP